MRKKPKNERGFTLVELLVVIAIIGILAAIVAPNAFQSIEKGKVAAAEADYKAIKAAALNFYTDTGKWAPSYTSTVPDSYLVTQPTSGYNGWNGPYIERWPSRNPWGGYYRFYNSATPPSGASSVWGTLTGSGTYRWLQLDQVPGVGPTPTGAAQKLRTDLGDTVVYVPSSGSTVYILISKD
ncbi:MAG: prepilin-type N-terminal cleavage/methylation domain-containing protein [Armatimonadetes bacterium]|nr:prepilin-type N-terminal cleavage/methylation domain-containing protein [Armatimonadota bacterium]